MDYAKSIRYAGTWVEAAACNHSSVENLGLMCPNCNELVFWVEGHTRNLKEGKQTEIKPRFNHYKKVAADCELRVNQTTQKQVAQFNNVARGQLKEKVERWFFLIFQRYFTKGLASTWKSGQFFKELQKTFTSLPPSHSGDVFKSAGWSFWERQLKDFRKYILMGDSLGDTGFEVACALYSEGRQRINESLSTDLKTVSPAQLDCQLSVVREIVLLLLTNQQTILRNSYCCAITWVALQFFKDPKNAKFTARAIADLKATYPQKVASKQYKPEVLANMATTAQTQFSALALIPWGFEFERLESNPKIETEIANTATTINSKGKGFG